MRKTWKFIMACTAIACMSLSTGCSDEDAPKNDDNNIDNPVTPNPDEPDGSLKEPEKAKEKLNEVGKEVVSLVNADDFKDLATVVDAFNSLSDAAEYYELSSPNINPGYKAYAQKILAAANGNTKALYTMSRTTHQASEYYGTYEYKNGEWIWTQDASKGKFVATFPVEGSNAEVTATSSGTETDFTYDGETVKVPAKIEASIVWKGNTLAKVEVNTSNLKSSSPYTADIDAKVTIGTKYIITSTVKANDKNVTSNKTVTIDGKEAVVTKAVIGGQNITSDSEEIEFDERVNTAEAQAVILGDAYITFKCDDVKGFYAIINESDENSGSNGHYPMTKEEQIAEVKKHNQKEEDKAKQNATDHTKYVKGDLRFVSQTESSATLGFQAYKDHSYEAYWGEEALGIEWEDWQMEPIAVFNDGSKMSFDELDGENSPFKGFIDSLDDLIEAFGNLLE